MLTIRAGHPGNGRSRCRNECRAPDCRFPENNRCKLHHLYPLSTVNNDGILSNQQIRNSNDPFMSFSAELITDIMCRLPSFSDDFAFAAICRRLRRIWSEDVTFIYKHVAPRTIKCEHDARILPADQGGAAADSPVLSVRDVLRLVRNSHIVEKSIGQFNRDIVCKVTRRI